MLTKTVKRPLAIAMSASLAAHLLIAGWFLWSLARWVQPTDKARVLTLQFSSSTHDDPQTHEAERRADTLRDTPVAARAAVAHASVPQPVRQLAAAEPTVDPVLEHEVPVGREASAASEPAEPGQTDLPTPDSQRNAAASLTSASLPREAAAQSPEPAETASGEPAGDPLMATRMPAASAPVENPPVTTTGPSRSVATAMLADANENALAFSQTERKMMERKLKKWASELHRVSADTESLRWRHKGQLYEARIRRMPASSETEIDKLAIEVITERDGQALSTELHMKMLAFSHFAQFVHRWDPNVQIHDDTLDGRFHSNSRILLTADKEVAPRFLGKVTTASSGVQFAGRRGYRAREQIFLGGLETGVKRIPMRRRQAPAALDSKEATTVATTEGQSEDHSDGPSGDTTGGANDLQPQVVRFEDHTHIRFAPDGSFSWYAGDPADSQTVITSGGPVYLAGARGKTLFVSGELAGSVLVYSPTRIVIEGNLTYAQPESDAEVNQAFLGLVSEGNVEIAEPEVTGPEPLYVHAAIYAGQKFKVRNYRRRDYSRLYIYGSLSAGTLSATEPRYATHIEFDRRLEDQRPPGYPVTNRFELAAWDRQWRPLDID